MQYGSDAKLSRRRFLHRAAGTAALAAVASFVKAQTYPTRAITVVVPFPAGGPADLLGRIIAERMQVTDASANHHYRKCDRRKRQRGRRAGRARQA